MCVCVCVCVIVCVYLRVGVCASACMFLSVLVRVSAFFHILEVKRQQHSCCCQMVHAEINMSKLEYLCPFIAPNSIIIICHSVS